MDRRTFLSGAVGAATAVTGCVGPGDGGATVRELPARPAALTPESVAAYAADYEAVRAHNAHVEAGAVEVTVDAVATFDHASGDEHVATAQHEGTVSHGGDGGRSVDRVEGDPVPYVVTPDRTLRLSVERRRVGASSPEGPADGTAPLGVRLCNVTDEARAFGVTVTRERVASDEVADGRDDIADAGRGPVLSKRVALDPRSAVELLAITDVRGGYRVTARMENDGVTGQGRIEVALPNADRGPNADVVVSEGGVSARHLPAFDGP
jgi:hypothetical protein